MLDHYIPEKYLHFAFDVGVILKGIDGLLELIGGFALFFIRPEQIYAFTVFITRNELLEDSHDVIANYLLHAGHISGGLEWFGALYLFSHGVIKILIVLGLWTKNLWAYKFGIIIFSLFVIFQLYRYSFTHSNWLIWLSVLDMIIVFLTWHEYVFIRRNSTIHNST